MHFKIWFIPIIFGIFSIQKRTKVQILNDGIPPYLQFKETTSKLGMFSEIKEKKKETKENANSWHILFQIALPFENHLFGGQEIQAISARRMAVHFFSPWSKRGTALFHIGRGEKIPQPVKSNDDGDLFIDRVQKLCLFLKK